MNDLIFQQKGLSLEKLNLLCRIAQAGGIRGAVGDDPSSQSLASRQIKELSEYAGVPLTRRVGRSVELTSDGEALVTVASDFFSKLDGFLRQVRNQPQMFRLGVGDSIFQWYLLPKMQTFKERFPKVELVPYSYSTREIIQKIENRELDAGIVRTASHIEKFRFVRILGTVKYMLFVPRRLMSGKGKKTPQLKDIPLCTLTGEGMYARAMENLFSIFAASPSISCSSATQMFSAVQSGQYAAILPSRARVGFREEETACFTLPELSSFSREIALVSNSEKDNRVVGCILDYLKTIIEMEELNDAYKSTAKRA